MDNYIVVRYTSNYGNEAIYPVCTQAAIFANIAGTKTLTPCSIKMIKDLGYSVIEESNAHLNP